MTRTRRRLDTALGVLTLLCWAWLVLPVVWLLVATSAYAEIGTALLSAPEAGEALAAAGKTPQEAGAAWGAAMRNAAIRQAAPGLAVGAAALAAGVLLVLRRRAGRWVALGVAGWLAGASAVGRIRAAFAPARLEFLPSLSSERTVGARLFGVDLPAVDAATLDAAIRWGWIAAVVAAVGLGLWSERRAAPPGAPAA